MLSELSYKKIIPFIVSLALFMEALDATIINTAIPAMSESLRVNPVDLKIALISYLLSLAVFIPISGWVADKFGIKKVFTTALIVFTLSSIWCGFAHNLYELVIARTIQGLGGSLTLPVGRLILVRTFERHELINTMSRVVIIAAMGLMLGPVLGGLITHYFSWHWIFWVNVPVGIITILLAKYWIEDYTPQAVHTLDKLGFILFGGGLAGLIFGLSALSETSIPYGVAVFIMAAAVLLLVFYCWHSRSQKFPIVKTELFSARTFQVSVLGNLFSRLGFGGVPFLLPLLLQIGLGFSPQLAGILLAPMAVGVLLVKFLVLKALRVLGYKKLLIINTGLVALALWAFILIDAETSLYFIGFLTFMYGFLISLQFSAMNSLAYADLAPSQLSAATSIMSTMQQLAQSIGVAVSALLLRIFAPSLDLTSGVFDQVFFSMGIITFFSIGIFLRLQAQDGHQMMRQSAVKETL